MDRTDPVLGFFHRWVEEFAKTYEHVHVICLFEGSHELSSNVSVYSLGKEHRQSRLAYITRFIRYIVRLRREYDAVFVHMNQEYVILGWVFWKLWGKKVYLWRNHVRGDWLTRFAVLVSNKVFYTSTQSFTARFTKAVKMPVGVDTDFFKPDPSTQRISNSVLFLGRISPVKKVLEFIESIKENDYSATIAGPILPQDREYGEKVKQALTPKIKYIGPVTQEGARELYQTHETYVNMTPEGSFDKTIVEALASGMKLRVDNRDARNIDPKEHSLKRLMEKLKKEI